MKVQWLGCLARICVRESGLHFETTRLAPRNSLQTGQVRVLLVTGARPTGTRADFPQDPRFFMSDAPDHGAPGAPTDTPLVSCLMTTADRHDLCRRAIHCYIEQTYPNTELIVLDNGDTPMKAVLDEFDVPTPVKYQYVERTPDLSLGGLRNMSLDMADGDFIVPQWDDDDWSHPDRLARQVEVLQQGHDACALAGTLMHVDQPEYFDHPFIGLLPNGVPPTIMHRRDDSIRYPNILRTEDTKYVNDWLERDYVIMPKEESYLYLRYFHGRNLWEQVHFVRRMRNTPKDLLLYIWHRYVRGDMFRHPRFDLTEKMEAAFHDYLDNSLRYNLLNHAEASSLI